MILAELLLGWIGFFWISVLAIIVVHRAFKLIYKLAMEGYQREKTYRDTEN